MKITVKFYGGPRDGEVKKLSKKEALEKTPEPSAPGHYALVPQRSSGRTLSVRWVRH